MVTRIAGLLAGLILCASAYGQTADDCITRFEQLRGEFEAAAAANGLVEPPAPFCITEGNMISLDAEGPLPPISCEGGEWDHWHLQATALFDNDAACILMLRGLDAEGDPKGQCGTDEIRIELRANEGAEWRNYLREVCRAAE